MIESPSKNSLSLTRIEDLEEKKLIPEDKQEEVRRHFRESIDWQSWVKNRSATMGVLFLLAGIMFFFASNWKEMSPIVRFGILEGAVALSILLAIVKNPDSLLGKNALLIGSFLTGVLLAVYGQVYQTGADAFEVYALWAGLIFLWVLVGKYLPLWTLWLTVVVTAICLYFGQVVIPAGKITWDAVMPGISLLLFLVLAAWEYLHRSESFGWLGADWFRPVILTAALGFLSITPFRLIFEFWRKQDPTIIPVIGCLLFAAASIVIPLFYYYYRKDILAVGLSYLATSTMIVLAAARMILESSFDDLGGWFFTAVISILIFGGAATLLIKMNRSLNKEEAKS